jgi:hypothetical protein
MPQTTRRHIPQYITIHLFVQEGKGSRDISVGTATGYGPDDRGVRVQVPVQARISLHVVQTGTGGSFSRNKAAEA